MRDETGRSGRRIAVSPEATDAIATGTNAEAGQADLSHGGRLRIQLRPWLAHH
jgi:hypothetical protein